MDLGLNGKRALITGATKGIGRRIAERLAQEGAAIALCARNQTEVAEAVAALQAGGATAWGRSCDVGNADDYRGWLADAIEALGGVDIFVANVTAGGFDANDAQWRANFEVDVMGTVRGCEAVLPKMVTGGAIVVIGTTAAVETFVGPNPYNAMKASLITYTKQLSQAVAAQNVRVNIVSPGPIEFAGGAWENVKAGTPDFYRKTLEQQPMGRLGRPEEVADAVAFFASERASWITGINVIVDGGFTRRVAF
jgi:NAD(P)-dependent dehydrogenase (short-subunit alcohol dehydrogenase family)